MLAAGIIVANMKTKNSLPLLPLTLALAWNLGGIPSLAQAADGFVLDPARSVISLAGSLVGVQAQEQGPGSLQSRLSGTLLVEWTPDTIHFPGGSAMAVEETGEWEPGIGGTAGRAPADFGAKASLGLLGGGIAAARNLIFDAETPAPVALINGEFDGSGLLFLFPPGGAATLDYRLTGLVSGSGSEVLGGYATNAVANAGSVRQEGDLITLTIPLHAEYLLDLLTTGDSTLVITGQLVATRQLVATGPAIDPPVIDDGNLSITWSGGGELEVSSDCIHWTGTGNQSGSFSEPVSSSGTRFYRIGPG